MPPSAMAKDLAEIAAEVVDDARKIAAGGTNV